jgi:hypothetical protein
VLPACAARSVQSRASRLGGGTGRLLRFAPVALALALPLALGAARASAQPRDGAERDEKAVAREHFDRARALHQAGRYGDAAGEYLEAYAHYPAPVFLFDAGQVYRLAGDQQKALEHYRRYLELEPDGKGSADAREFVAELEAAIEKERAAGRAGGGSGEDRGGDGGGPGGGGAAGGGPHTAAGVGEPSPPPPPDRGAALRIAGLSAVGLGAMALLSATAFGVKAKMTSDELGDYHGPWTPEQDDTYRVGERAETMMTISLVVSGVAIAAGAGLYLWGDRRRVREPCACRRDRAAGRPRARGRRGWRGSARS